MLIDDLVDAAHARGTALVLRPDPDSDGFVAEIGGIHGIGSTPAGAMRALRIVLNGVAPPADLDRARRRSRLHVVPGGRR